MDAAAVLVRRWGYDKTTMDDIARQAGVGKDTIYLHWATREALFTALVRRERMIMLAEVRDRVKRGPVTFPGLLRELALELTQQPLMRATLLGDSEMLGKLVRQRGSRHISTEILTDSETYVRALLEHGALRADLSPAEHLTVLAAIFYGFHRVPELVPGAYSFTTGRLADLLADTATRALGADRSASAEDTRAVGRASSEYLDFAVGIAQEKLRRSLAREAT